MFIWYYNGYTGQAFNARSGTFATIMNCNESYWLVPGSEITGCLLCGSPDIGHSHFTTDDGLVVPC